MSRRIAVLIFPDFQILDATGPIAAFEIANRYVPGSYTLELCSAEPGPVKSSSGVVLQANAMRRSPAPDTLLVVGGQGTVKAAADRRVLSFVRGAKSRRIASVCSGAYVLAAAGLLDGLRATTHWYASAEFERRFPKVRLEADRIYIRQGKVWTSAGVTAGIDLTLALIGEDLGEDVARRTAQQLVVYYRRPGGQSQFSALLELSSGSRFDGLLGWAREHLRERLDVERLAERAAMSPRHFARAFAAETGITPARAIERLRVEAAKSRVEAGRESVEAIASATGFGNPERMRRAFVRAFGQPPQALRRLADR